MTTESDRAGATRVPRIVAHRGASSSFPENTIAAFRGASELGADWVELDVRRTSDGELVVHHDATVGPNGPPIVGQRRDQLPPEIPALSDVLKTCKQCAPPLGVNVEIKSAPGEPDYDPEHPAAGTALKIVNRMLSEGGATPAVLFSSFDLAAIDRVHALDPKAPTGLLVALCDDPHEMAVLARSRGHVAFNPAEWLVSSELVEHAHLLGLEVNTWTVDDPARIRELFALGVDGLITNVPDVARAVIDQRDPR